MKGAGSFAVARINGSRSGFTTIAEFVGTAASALAVGDEAFTLDMSSANWVNAPSVAALGAAIEWLTASGMAISVVLPTDGKVRAILRRNGFTSRFIGGERYDPYGSVLPYETFDVGEAEAVLAYVQDRFLGREELAELPDDFREGMHLAFWELHANSEEHGRARRVHVAGQYYPNDHSLSFQITDDGVGFKQCVNSALSCEWTALECIAWATQPSKSTRRSGVPGGLGLKTLIDIVGANRGQLQIVSGDGYWELSNRGNVQHVLPFTCPFTAVTVTVNTDEASLAALSRLAAAGDEDRFF